ncbi:MAG: replication protein [Patescibacteria group bacterium]|nr:replication protein [Patescibacteria group bacterium]
MISLKPNSTQVPNIVMDEWLPDLSDTELRIILIIARQTTGWGKERDWITRHLLAKKINREVRIVTRAVGKLVKLGIIKTFNEKGIELITPSSRQRQKIYYELSGEVRQKSLFGGANSKLWKNCARQGDKAASGALQFTSTKCPNTNK